MQRQNQGIYRTISRTISTVGRETVRAFVPNALPPNPPIFWTAELRENFDNAIEDVQSVSNYLSALNFGLERIRENYRIFRYTEYISLLERET